MAEMNLFTTQKQIKKHKKKQLMVNKEESGEG